jgi:DNA adenine methylase
VASPTETPTPFIGCIDRPALLEAAGRSLSHSPRPFIRWAGSKRGLLAHIVHALPDAYNTYYEPFLGSGSLFFLLQPQRAVLGDACTELVDVFRAVANDYAAICRYLEEWSPDRAFYYELRSSRSRGHLKRAAEFIYLNRTCWNGLYRVNAAGEFNVPYGRPKTDFLIDRSNLRECAKLLRQPQVSLVCSDFADALASAGEGDLVFLDPPYVTGHNNNGFIDYNETLFSWADQERLATSAHELVGRGARVVVTNANHSDVLDLYGGFQVRPFDRHSTLASDQSKRRPVSEALIWL